MPGKGVMHQQSVKQLCVKNKLSGKFAYLTHQCLNLQHCMTFLILVNFSCPFVSPALICLAKGAKNRKGLWARENTEKSATISVLNERNKKIMSVINYQRCIFIQLNRKTIYFLTPVSLKFSLLFWELNPISIPLYPIKHKTPFILVRIVPHLLH